MKLSIWKAITDSFDWMSHVLFRNFDIAKWFVLGFCAFLAGLGEDVGGGTGFSDSFSDDGRMSGAGKDGLDFLFSTEFMLILAIVVVVLVVVLLIWFVLTWLSSRGKFMFLDGIVYNRGAVVKPWHDFSELGNNLFLIRLILGVAAAAVFLVIFVLFGLAAWPSIGRDEFTVSSLMAFMPLILMTAVVVLLFIFINAVLNDFIVPIMYKRNIKTMDAIQVFSREILSPNVVDILLFYLTRILLSVGIGVIIMLVTCLTCCIAAIPYLSAVIFLPIHVFMRGFSVFFIQQIGDEWQFVNLEETTTPPPIPE